MTTLIKRYANRKLYNTETSRYITLRGIAELLNAGEEVQVIDNESGEDITSVTLSQILVDTERDGRSLSGNLLGEIFGKGGGALYEALRKGAQDAGESFEEFQRNMKRMVGADKNTEGTREWIAFGQPDFEKVVGRALERVAGLLDLPKRSELNALADRIDHLTELVEKLLAKTDSGPGGPEAGDRP